MNKYLALSNGRLDLLRQLLFAEEIVVEEGPSFEAVYVIAAHLFVVIIVVLHH